MILIFNPLVKNIVLGAGRNSNIHTNREFTEFEMPQSDFLTIICDSLTVTKKENQELECFLPHVVAGFM